MSDDILKVGTIVIHPTREDWGPGKVVKAEAGRVHVVWRDLPDREAKRIVTSVIRLQKAPEQSDPVLDNLPPLVEEEGKLFLPKERVTFQQAISAFHAKYPQGFSDPGYIGDAHKGERYYKWVAHEYCLQRLGNGRFRELLHNDPVKLAEEVIRCAGKVNLLHMTEQAALRDALQVESPARTFLARLADLLDAATITEDVFAPYAEATCNLPAERGRVATWPVATIIPFLFKPDCHMFLKPGVTKNAADSLGFHLNYRTEPNWLTYRRLLDMAETYMEKLAALKPRDFIDVQSFFWLACGD